MEAREIHRWGGEVVSNSSVAAQRVGSLASYILVGPCERRSNVDTISFMITVTSFPHKHRRVFFTVCISDLHGGFLLFLF